MTLGVFSQEDREDLHPPPTFDQRKNNFGRGVVGWEKKKAIFICSVQYENKIVNCFIKKNSFHIN